MVLICITLNCWHQWVYCLACQPTRCTQFIMPSGRHRRQPKKNSHTTCSQLALGGWHAHSPPPPHPSHRPSSAVDIYGKFDVTWMPYLHRSQPACQRRGEIRPRFLQLPSMWRLMGFLSFCDASESSSAGKHFSIMDAILVRSKKNTPPLHPNMWLPQCVSSKYPLLLCFLVMIRMPG